mgnify:CR=1 FL=1
MPYAANPYWDTHAKNFPIIRLLCPPLDAGWAALVDDLADRGLLDSTLVVWMGEMGRTPKVSRGGGRDHFGRAWSAVLGGAGVKGGAVVGSTTPDGEHVKDRPIVPTDLLATILSAVGLDPGMQFSARDGVPVDRLDPQKAMAAGQTRRLVDAKANPVTEVLTG